MPTPAGTRFLSAIQTYRLALLQCATDKSFCAPFVKAREPLARFCSGRALGAGIPPAGILRYGCYLKHPAQRWWGFEHDFDEPRITRMVTRMT